jgi:hypothetical protein
MSIFALLISRGPSNLAFPHVCAKTAAPGNLSVEALLPEGGGHVYLFCSGRSAILMVDADSGTPDLDFTE